jgi:molybdopterin synthase catalytic subunit
VAPLQVRVRLFAVQRELVGAREVILDLVGPATVEDAWSALIALHPGLAPGRPAVRFALDGAYVDATEPVAADAELAIIPPVSGGAQTAGETGDEAAGEASVDAEPPTADWPILELRAVAFGAEVLAELADRLARPDDGAVAAFLGRTRETAGTAAPGQEAEAARFAGETVEALEYEAHESMALAVLGQIAAEVRDRFGVTRLAIVHRTGHVALGETSVAIVACARHRGSAFAAARYAIDETKARAPIWKAELFRGGRVWIGHPARSGPPEGPQSDPG